MKEVIQHGPKDVLLTVAGNKSDRVEEEVVDVNIASEFAKSHGANFYLVSAKTNTNVDEMYRDLGIRKFPHFINTPDESSLNDHKPEEKSHKKKTKEKTHKLVVDGMKENNRKDGCC